jgi:hypothetical protein
LSANANGNDIDYHGELGVPTQNLQSRAKTMIYPVIILLFVAMANIRGWSNGWLLEIASAIVIVFTAVELHRRWIKRE